MRRGIGSAQPLDLKSTVEIRSVDERTVTGGTAVSATEKGGGLTSRAQR
jgi:shikimate kinase